MNFKSLKAYFSEIVEQMQQPAQKECQAKFADQFARNLELLVSAPYSERYAKELMKSAIQCVLDVGALNTKPKYLLLPTQTGKIDAYFKATKRTQTLTLLDQTGEFEYELFAKQGHLTLLRAQTRHYADVIMHWQTVEREIDEIHIMQPVYFTCRQNESYSHHTHLAKTDKKSPQSKTLWTQKYT
jgi:hypothetical protein